MSETPGVADYYQALRAEFHRSQSSSANVHLGNTVVAIETKTDARLASFLQTLRHLIELPGVSAQTKLLVIFREDDDMDVPSIPWTWNSPRVSQGDVTCQYFGSSHSLMFWNRQTGIHILVISAVTEHLLTRPEYMRVVLQGFLAEFSLDSVHGGTLGTSIHGVLITNRGGSGKSSLVAAGAKRGMKTLGDDFLMIDANDNFSETHELFSIFRTLKLSTNSPSWQDYSAHLLEKGDDKDLFFLDSVAPDAMTQKQHITAIVIPTVGAEFSFRELDFDSVIRALAPNSLAMGMNPARTLRALKDFARDLPRYSMVVTPDLEPALTEIAALAGS